MRHSRPLLLLALLATAACCATARAAWAQQADVATVPFPRLGSELDRADRLQTLRDSAARHPLLRANGTQVAATAAGRDTIVLLHPELAFSYHSAHPWGGNDGALRAGRGGNLLVTTGVAFRVGRLSALLAPQLLSEANSAFQTIPYSQEITQERNVWANPFYGPAHPLDYPLRFGAEPRQALDIQGRVSVDLGLRWTAGIGREQRWWGPAQSNALLLSSNAPPLEQLFVESREPLRTRVGDFETQVFLGRLRESAFFDTLTQNDTRTLSAAAVTWRPPARWGLWPSLGIARAVMTAGSPQLGDALGFLADAGRPWSRPADTTAGKEQITSVFARWHVPEAGAEAYVEWVRFEQPASLRDLLEQPGHSQGYTLGVQWARPWRAGLLQVMTEVSYAEPSPSIRVRPVGWSYVGTSVPQGWTHEGQMLGPWNGPGSSSQMAALDLWYPDWRAGFTLGRLRRDVNPRFENLAVLRREDVQLYASLRYGRAWRGFELTVEFTEGLRLNHLYQAYGVPGSTGGETTGIDLLNRSLALSLTPRLPRRTSSP